MKIPFLILSLLAVAITSGIADDPNNLADTFNGQPIGSGLSIEAANGYVDSLIKSWVDSKANSTNPKIDMNDTGRMASDVRRLGVANLIAVYGQAKGDVLYVANATRAPADEMKRAVLETALNRTATTSDIDALLSLYDAHPLILEVLIDHPEWDADSRVGDFLVAKLDQVPEAYKKSDLAPSYLLTLAARNSTSAVQNKLDSFLADATTNNSHYQNAHLYVNLLTVYAQSSNSAIAKHLPDIFAVLGSRTKTSVSDPYTEVSTAEVFAQLQWALQFGTTWKGNMASAATALFSDQKTRDIILKMAQASEDSNYNGVNLTAVLLSAAACGDKSALKKLADFSQQSNGSSSVAKKYLATINCQRTGDKISQIINHIDNAVYDPATVTWTIAATN